MAKEAAAQGDGFSPSINTDECRYENYELPYSGIRKRDIDNMNLNDIYMRMDRILKRKNR